MVICQSKNSECPERCRHSKPHDPKKDIVDFDDEGNEVFGLCTEKYHERCYPGSKCYWKSEMIDGTFCS